MLYENEPKDFKPSFKSVGCFIEHKSKILLLHRQDSCPQGNTWGLPSGKINSKESPLIAMAREIFEETGLDIPKSKIRHHSKNYIKFPDFDFVYHLFHAQIDSKPEVLLNSREHKNYIWIYPQDTSRLHLIEDLDSCIKLVYGRF